MDESKLLYRWWSRFNNEPPIDYILKNKECVAYLMEGDNLFDWLEVVNEIKEHNNLVEEYDKKFAATNRLYA